jgi:DNA adenine methylase
LVIKNTSFIESIYSGHNLNIKSFDKKYSVSFMNRNNKNAEHLLITNY